MAADWAREGWLRLPGQGTREVFGGRGVLQRIIVHVEAVVPRGVTHLW